MPVEQMLFLVGICFSAWVVASFGVVWLVRRLYSRWIERFMRGGGTERHERGASSSLPPPATLTYYLPPPPASASARFRERHRRRLVTYFAGGVVYALTFGVVWIGKVALEDGKLTSLPIYLTSAAVLWSAANYAVIPLVAMLVVLKVRRFQHQASGVWVAALLFVALPLLKVNTQVSSTDIVTVLVRTLAGAALAVGYLRFNAWRASRSPWSFMARGLNSFFVAFGGWWFLSFGVLQHEWVVALTFFCAPYLAYELALRCLFAFWRPAPVSRLLYLRVFGRTAQADRFYRTLVYDWSTVGSVRLIGAPDLASRTMNPQVLAAFVAGSLRRMFEWSEAQLEKRIEQAERPFVDTLYRTVEVLCSGDVWQNAVRRLARGTDVVVMDLRGFQEKNRGCAWELGQLVDQVPLSRVLLCTDASTDRAALDATLSAAWASVTPLSPNYATREPFRVLDVQDKPECVAGAAWLLASQYGAASMATAAAAAE